METRSRAAILAVAGLILPQILNAQGTPTNTESLHGVLAKVYDEMMPLCSQLISVGRGLAGFAALWYIASRIWRHLANAEPIDFYPLFRPFGIGLCIILFPSLISLINAVMQPTVSATGAMVKSSNAAIEKLLKQKEEAIKHSTHWKMYVGITGNGDQDRWYRYTHKDADPSSQNIFESIGNDIKFAMEKYSYNFRNSIKEWMSEVLRVFYEAAALCINTLRTFQLIVLAILGPLVFGLAVFDGFQHTLTVWLARYINIFLWLPVANIFGSVIGKVQELMIKLDLAQIKSQGDTFFSTTDVAYLVFLIIGIVGYITVPSVANYIVHAGGGSAFVQRVTTLFNNSSDRVINTATAGAGMVADSVGNAASRMAESMANYNTSSPYFKDNSDQSAGYMNDKLKGNS